jgi:hypothetical protein
LVFLWCDVALPGQANFIRNVTLKYGDIFHEIDSIILFYFFIPPKNLFLFFFSPSQSLNLAPAVRHEKEKKYI